jgi:hypothetical protein
MNLREALFCRSNQLSDPLVDPQWQELFFEVPGDGQGAILILVQVIAKSSPTEQLPPPPSIIPKTKKAFIEIIALGLRNMVPFNFVPIQSPFLEIEHYSFTEQDEADGSRKISNLFKQRHLDDKPKKSCLVVKTLLKTGTSKLPVASNPNFLEKLTIQVTLPEKALYAQPLVINARDSRLGGFMKPIVGVGIIPMMDKIPWWPEEYDESGAVIPCSEYFVEEVDAQGQMIKVLKTRDSLHPPTFKPPNETIGGGESLPLSDDNDAEEFEEDEMDDMRGVLVEEEEEDNNDDDSISRLVRRMRTQRNRMTNSYVVGTMDEPSDMDDIIKQRISKIDTGTGVFGALHHIKAERTSKFREKGNAAVFSDPDWTQDEGDQPPKWSIGRSLLPSDAPTIEEQFKNITLFETYDLTRGQANGSFGNTLKISGKFKCLIRVYERKYEKETLMGDGGQSIVVDDPLKPLDDWPPSSLSPETLEKLLKPRKYEIRLYALT